ncbi:VgrG protein [Pseudomonas chlororaphis subsp. aurantiaca]|nr:VgrG protein [Pseudomonas chlororaphis subsp. aurantiaca]
MAFWLMSLPSISAPAPSAEYCAQYGESDFEFVQHLCAEEGVAWHHQHSQDGHRLVFTEYPVFSLHSISK